MPDFSKHDEVLRALEDSQESDLDNRNAVREAHLFVDKRDGQWEPYWWNARRNKPRYTFDMTGPIVDQISGEMEQADFDITVRPSGGEATKEDAKLLDGLIRNIENISNAKDVFNLAGRGMVTGGFDAWVVKQAFVDDDSFDQDLIVEWVPNAVDSVWFGPFNKPDASDATYCYVLEAVARSEYDERWPEGSGQSVGQNRIAEAYYNKRDLVIVGQVYYIEMEKRELSLLSDGRVVEAEQLATISDDLAQVGITVTDTRNRPRAVVKSRLFDGTKWLTEAEPTVFNQLPVIPTFANFKIIENKPVYRGVVEKLLDPQRVFNYIKSREVEEVALAPRTKYFMTQAQAEGHEGTLGTLNTNSDPVQFYNNDPEIPGPPQQSGGAPVNPGLNLVSESMNLLIGQSAGLFAANLGDNPGLQSGIAIDKLQKKGDTGTIKFFKSQERAICRTAKILIDAIPKVYDTQRQVRILKEDGSFDMAILNQQVLDQQSGQIVTLNDLSRGKYDVACSAGQSFQNRQQQTVEAITQLAQFDPGVIETAGDILYSNIPSPGMDLISERKRRQLFEAGLIPDEQLTDEEKAEIEQAQLEAQQNPPPPDPAMVLAQAEVETAQATTNKVNVDAQVAQRREDREDFKASSQVQLEQAKLEQQGRQFAFTQALAGDKQTVDEDQAIIGMVKTKAETLKLIREAQGVDSIVGPGTAEAYVSQAGSLNQAIDKSDKFTDD